MKWFLRIIGVKLTSFFAQTSVELELDDEAYKVSEIIFINHLNPYTCLDNLLISCKLRDSLEYPLEYHRSKKENLIQRINES